MRRYLLLVSLSLCLAWMAGALGVMAWRLGWREANYRDGEALRELQEQVRTVATACRALLEQEEQQLINQLRETPASRIDELPGRLPLLRNVFVTDVVGRPLHPGPDAALWQRFHGLFAPDQAGSDRGGGASRFSREIDNALVGWIPWFSENRLRPLVWAKVTGEEDLVFGGEVDVSELLARMAPLLPPPSATASLALADVTADGVEASVAMDIDPQQLPNYRVLGYLDVAATAVSSGRTSTGQLAQLAGLLLGLWLGGLLLLWLVTREIWLVGRQSRFVAGVSQELAAPLAEIRRLARLLGGAAGGETRRRVEGTGAILIACDRWSRILGKAVDFSQMEEGAPRGGETEFRLGEVLLEVAESWHPELSERGLELRMEIAPEPIVVTMDRDALIRALGYLLDNVIVHAATGREVTLSAAQLPDGEQVVRVLDRGPGIATAQREKIFRKFARGEARPGVKPISAGLGLAIARKLLRDQGGDLTCHPRPGGGAEFRITW